VDSRGAYKTCHSEQRLCGVKKRSKPFHLLPNQKCNLQFLSAPGALDKPKMEILRSEDCAQNDRLLGDANSTAMTVRVVLLKTATRNAKPHAARARQDARRFVERRSLLVPNWTDQIMPDFV
jgi:hypothetical protein